MAAPRRDDPYELSTYDEVIAQLDEAEANEADRAKIQTIISAVSRLVETMTRRHWRSRTWKFVLGPGDTKTDDDLPALRGDGRRMIYLPEMPVHDVSALSVDEIDLTWGEEFDWNPNTGRLTRTDGGIFPSGSLVRVSFLAGYLPLVVGTSDPLEIDPATEPVRAGLWGWPNGVQDLANAVTRQCAEFYRKRTRNRDGIASVSVEGQTTTYQEKDLLDDVRLVIKAHTRSQVLG